MTDIHHPRGSAIRANRRVRVRPQEAPPRVQAELRRRLERGPVRHGSPRRRLVTTWLIAILATGALVFRLVQLQVSPSEDLVAAGEQQRIKEITLDAPRGAILDRNGADLAISVPQTTFFLDSRTVTDPLGDAAKLAPVLGEDPMEIQAKLASGKSFVYLARQVDDVKAAAIEALGLEYIHSYREDKRFQPAGTLASSVIGRTDPDLKGISGLEMDYEAVLKGTSGELVVERGAGGRSIPGAEEELQPATAGSNVVLTLDRGLQYEVEQMLKRVVDATEAKGGTVIVAKPNGEVLVDANVVRRPIEPLLATPTTIAAPATTVADGDEGDEGDDTSAATELPVRYGPAETTNENRAVTWTYEPGSINKVITAAAVLEEGLATPDAVRPVPSSLDFYGTRFGQETRSTDEDLSLRDVLAKSDNPGTINWANDLGAEKLHEYLRRFGLGSKTALDFPGESGGKVLDLADWSGTSLPTAAIGQGIAATPMQMLDVYNAIANDGVLLAPRLVLGTEDATGKFTPTPIGEPRTVVSAETAAAVRDMLTSVVQDGTGKRAQVPGYTVAGKTGTAWKAFDGDYGEPGKRKLVTSFAGFFPAADPELTILVVIDEPANPESTGGAVAAPLFSQVATYAASHLRIPPDGGGATVDPATERVRAEVELIPPATTTPGTTAPPKQG